MNSPFKLFKNTQTMRQDYLEINKLDFDDCLNLFTELHAACLKSPYIPQYLLATIKALLTLIIFYVSTPCEPKKKKDNFCTQKIARKTIQYWIVFTDRLCCNKPRKYLSVFNPISLSCGKRWLIYSQRVMSSRVAVKVKVE